MLLSAEKRQEAVAALQKMISLLGLRAEIRDSSRGDTNVLSIQTEKPGRLIGRKGIYLSSMELLVNRIVQKSSRSEDFDPIKIDIDGYARGGKDRPEDGVDEGAAAAPVSAEGVPPAVSERPAEERPAEDRRTDDRRPEDRRGGRSEGGRGRFEGRGDRGRGRDRGPGGPERFESRGEGRGRFEGRGERRESRDEGGDSRGAMDVEKLAMDAAKEVKLWGQPKTLGPFASPQRKAIHEALKNIGGVEAVSGPDQGGNHKTMTIHIIGTAPKAAAPAVAPAAPAQEGGPL